MKKVFQNKFQHTFVRIILGGLFIYSSLDKIGNPGDFSNIVNNFHILPAFAVNIFAMTLPWIELITGIFLVTGRFVKSASLLYSILVVIFIIALFQAQIRGINTNCGCFNVKPGSDSNLWVRLLLDFIMLFFSINLYVAAPEEPVKTSVQTQN